MVVPVPNVIGKTQADAEQLLKDNGLGVKATQVYSDEPAGQVTDQSPAAGSSLNEGAVVTISVSQGPLPVAAVPNVVGQSEADATQALQQAGFVAKTNQAYSDTAPAGTVVAQTPPGGVFAQTGATVEVTVSQGPPAARRGRRTGRDRHDPGRGDHRPSKRPGSRSRSWARTATRSPRGRSSVKRPPRASAARPGQP